MTESYEPYLLTPGPLTASKTTQLAMLRDWGSWDSKTLVLKTALTASAWPEF